MNQISSPILCSMQIEIITNYIINIFILMRFIRLHCLMHSLSMICHSYHKIQIHVAVITLVTFTGWNTLVVSITKTMVRSMARTLVVSITKTLIVSMARTLVVSITKTLVRSMAILGGIH